ncbi:unnamed protein product [Linum tenue]|uniref:S-protein homolog n=1 Tax=Linum tenue TaxID=586396 RepID=A0AAV0Q5G3_9ROSI|nr:unnamed protein product [Linum tenue]
MVVIITTLLLPSLVVPKDLWPTVNVTFENEVHHAVDLLCSFESTPRIRTLMPGDMAWWTVKDVLFPAVWCYLQVTDDFFGLFWGYFVSRKCGDGSHCRWRIKEDGLYYVQTNGELQYQWLYYGSGGFV